MPVSWVEVAHSPTEADAVKLAQHFRRNDATTRVVTVDEAVAILMGEPVEAPLASATPSPFDRY